MKILIINLEQIRSKKFILFLFYSTILLFWLLTKMYILSDEIRTKKTTTNYQISSDDGDTNASQFKIEMKNQFHLNIFDFKDFKDLQNNGRQDSGPCIRTRVKVSMNDNTLHTQCFK